ncbi:hypothetical protein LPJ66_003182 [Kickxella alabastrina]|uniref:Uncharacterized protein n=1 Tax=Kickxella alabastrina TaxID=61397 RepID=A0ACC1IMM9_9FUNG|nr:hypothetical protein LPJ66_003182 [Kickxella alabastrina]
MKRDILSATTSRARKKIDTNQISDPVLRDGIERLIERIFGTYPKDYSFGDKGLQYDSVCDIRNGAESRDSVDA